MNIDFTLPMTGSVARRLLHISTMCSMNLDDHVKQMATQNLISQDDTLMPLKGIRLAATQFIIDCDFRCAIPRMVVDLDRHMILNAIALSGYSGPITIASVGHIMDWKFALRPFRFGDVSNLTVKNAFLPENQEGRRDGILIIDWGPSLYNDMTIIGLAREFSKTIMFADVHQQKIDATINNHATVYPWWEMGIALFPSMPQNMFSLSEYEFKKQIGRTFDFRVNAGKVFDRDYLAIFYNVFLPHFIDNLGYYQDK